MAQERDSTGRFKSKSGDSGGGNAPKTPAEKRAKIREPISQEQLDSLGQKQGLTPDEAATVMDGVVEETNPNPEGYVHEKHDGDPEAAREALERLREEGTIEAATEALENLGDLQAEDGATPEGADPIPFEMLAEETGLDADRILVTAKVDGEEVTVPLSEAVSGYQRQEVFTRKTQELAEERQEIESVLEHSAARLEILDGLFQQNLSPEQRQAIGQAYQRVKAEQAALHAYEAQQRLPEEAALLAEKLGWESEEDAKAAKTKLANAATEYGFDPSDLENVTDHRLMLLLHDAAQYREMQSRSEEAKDVARSKRRKSKTLNPGTTGSQKRRPAKLSEARKRLAQTGRVDDAAAALDSILPDDVL